MAGPGRQVPPVNGDQGRGTSFFSRRSGGPGYDAVDVDDLLRRVAAELDSSRPAGPVIERATFRGASGRRYDVDAVDWFLEQLARGPNDCELAGLCPDPWGELTVAQFTRSSVSDPAKEPGKWRKDFARECENAWRDFDQQPGIYLRWERVGGRFRAARFEFELRMADQQTIASVRGWPIYGRMTVNAAGRSFTVNTPKIRARSTADSWPPGIAEIAARSWRDHAGHFAADTMKASAQRREARGIRELIDEAGMPILSTSGHSYYRRAYARVTFPDKRWLRFLVRGTGRRNAIMTAVDQARNKVARYRITRSDSINGFLEEVEIAVHPDRKLTDELILTIAISPPWLDHYFDTPS